MKDWYRSTCLKLPRHSESSSQSPSPVNARRVDSSSVGKSFNLQSMACPRCSMSRRPRNARPKAAVGCGSSRLLSRSPTWRRLWLAVCLGNLISVSLNCSNNLVGVSPSAVILATLQVALTVIIAVTISFSCAIHLSECYPLCWTCLKRWCELTFFANIVSATTAIPTVAGIPEKNEHHMSGLS